MQLQNLETRELEDGVLAEWATLTDHGRRTGDNHQNQAEEEDHGNQPGKDHANQTGEHDNHIMEDSKWWDGESQFLLDSQQLVEGLSLCDEFLQSQSSSGDGDGEQRNIKPCLSGYACIGAEDLKKDLEECQKLGPLDPINIAKEKTVGPWGSDYADEDPKQDSEQSQNLGPFDPSNLDLDTPPDFRLSQLVCSQYIFATHSLFFMWSYHIPCS